MKDRGAFMAVNQSVAQFAGGIAAAVAGMIVIQPLGEPLQRYNVLGYVVMCATASTIALMYPINKIVLAKQKGPNGGAGPGGFGAHGGRPAGAPPQGEAAKADAPA